MLSCNRSSENCTEGFPRNTSGRNTYGVLSHFKTTSHSCLGLACSLITQVVKKIQDWRVIFRMLILSHLYPKQKKNDSPGIKEITAAWSNKDLPIYPENMTGLFK